MHASREIFFWQIREFKSNGYFAISFLRIWLNWKFGIHFTFMKCKAALAMGPGQPLTFTEVDLIDPRADEVLVKVAATGLCLSDNYHRDKNTETYPILLGHESAGTIVKVGEGIHDYKPGDRVLVYPPYCGKCDKCKANHTWECPHCFDFWTGKQVDRTSPVLYEGKPVTTMSCHGSLATHMVVRYTTLCKIPDGIDFKAICPIGCGPVTGAGTLINYFNAQPGTTVVVSGMGTVGLSAIMGAKIRGCARIIAIDRNDPKLALAREFGATEVINSGDIANLSQLTGKIDYALDTTGNKELVTEIDKHLQPETKRCDVTFDGFWPTNVVGNSSLHDFLPELFKYYKEGKFPVDKIWTYYTFEQADQALADLANKKVMKPVIVMQD